eukprot:TRINITY_DN29505_c0_g1_i1.p1 TRINITY_DN29505_c0_g1~~TRINITY_DN29505_c0_g1_i1.p1  ORF type:complete len:831 (+),score=115.02 TRINITY_DN29505_c0_g1_i1:263-2755(+)
MGKRQQQRDKNKKTDKFKEHLLAQPNSKLARLEDEKPTKGAKSNLASTAKERHVQAEQKGVETKPPSPNEGGGAATPQQVSLPLAETDIWDWELLDQSYRLRMKALGVEERLRLAGLPNAGKAVEWSQNDCMYHQLNMTSLAAEERLKLFCVAPSPHSPSTEITSPAAKVSRPDVRSRETAAPASSCVTEKEPTGGLPSTTTVAELVSRGASTNHKAIDLSSGRPDVHTPTVVGRGSPLHAVVDNRGVEEPSITPDVPLLGHDVLEEAIMSPLLSDPSKEVELEQEERYCLTMRALATDERLRLALPESAAAVAPPLAGAWGRGMTMKSADQSYCLKMKALGAEERLKLLCIVPPPQSLSTEITYPTADVSRADVGLREPAASASSCVTEKEPVGRLSSATTVSHLASKGFKTNHKAVDLSCRRPDVHTPPGVGRGSSLHEAIDNKGAEKPSITPVVPCLEHDVLAEAVIPAHLMDSSKEGKREQVFLEARYRLTMRTLAIEERLRLAMPEFAAAVAPSVAWAWGREMTMESADLGYRLKMKALAAEERLSLEDAATSLQPSPRGHFGAPSETPLPIVLPGERVSFCSRGVEGKANAEVAGDAACCSGKGSQSIGRRLDTSSETSAQTLSALAAPSPLGTHALKGSSVHEDCVPQAPSVEEARMLIGDTSGYRTRGTIEPLRVIGPAHQGLEVSEVQTHGALTVAAAVATGFLAFEARGVQVDVSRVVSSARGAVGDGLVERAAVVAPPPEVLDNGHARLADIHSLAPPAKGSDSLPRKAEEAVSLVKVGRLHGLGWKTGVWGWVGTSLAGVGLGAALVAVAVCRRASKG